MDSAEVNLSKLYKRQIATVLVATFIVVIVISWWAMHRQAIQNHQVSLPLYHQVTTQALNAYLQNAEYEVNSAAQTLLYNKSRSEPKPALDVLFDQHDDFLLGGLDFFYITWLDKSEITDPRARLFIDEPIENLTSGSIIGGWSLQQTKEGVSLLVYKKSLVLKSNDWQGYLYGFISLEDNLTLMNALLLSADLDSVRLLSPKQDVLLSGVRVGFSDIESLNFYGAGTQFENSDDVYLLQIAKERQIDNQLLNHYLFWMMTCFIILFSIYLIFAKLFSRFFSKVLTTFEQDLDAARESTFQELAPLQRRMNENNARLNTQLSSFDLLMGASKSAIIFCDDTASIKQINKSAELLFAESVRSRTVFDFMPVVCHPSIQQALKGEVGISFDTTLANSNRIYHWRLFPYMTESYHRGVALIGSDVTTLQQLEWQLGELQQYAPEKSVEPQLILTEFNHILGDLDNIPYNVKEIWQKSLIQCLNELIAPASFSDVIPLGELLSQRLLITPCDLKLSGHVQINCSITSANVHSAWSSDVGLLISALIMMVHSSEAASQKRLCIQIFDDQIKLEATGISGARPIFKSLVYAVATRLGVECKLTNNNQLVVLYPFLEQTFTTENPVQNIHVVLIQNDYSDPALIEDILRRLDCSVSRFSSSESFFTEVGDLSIIDVLLIGFNEYRPTLVELPSVLKTRLGRGSLPIGWVSDCSEDTIEGLPNYSLSPHEYGVATFLTSILQTQAIDLKAGLVGSEGWLIIGGSNIGRAILYEELFQLSVAPYLIADIKEHQSLFSNEMVQVILLLDDSDAEYVVNLCEQHPRLIVISLDAAINNDAIYSYLLEKPYRKNQIQLLTEFVNQKIIEHEN